MISSSVKVLLKIDKLTNLGDEIKLIKRMLAITWKTENVKISKELFCKKI